MISRSLEAGRAGLEEVGQVALGVDLADQRPLALLGGQQGQAGRDGRLADAALAGDEEQLALEQVEVRTARSPILTVSGCWPSTTRPSADLAPKPTRRSVAGAADLDVGHLGRPAHRPGDPCGRSARASPSLGQRPLLDLLDQTLSRRHRPPARPRAPSALGDADAHVHLAAAPLMVDSAAPADPRTIQAPGGAAGAARVDGRPRVRPSVPAGTVGHDHRAGAERPGPAVGGDHGRARPRPGRRTCASPTPTAGPADRARRPGSAGPEREALGGRRAGPGRDPGPGRRPPGRGRGAGPVADLLRAGPGPDPALPRPSAGWPARPRSSCSPTTTSAPG